MPCSVRSRRPPATGRVRPLRAHGDRDRALPRAQDPVQQLGGSATGLCIRGGAMHDADQCGQGLCGKKKVHYRPAACLQLEDPRSPAIVLQARNILYHWELKRSRSRQLHDHRVMDCTLSTDCRPRHDNLSLDRRLSGGDHTTVLRGLGPAEQFTGGHQNRRRHSKMPHRQLWYGGSSTGTGKCWG